MELLLFNDDFPLTTTFGDLPVHTPFLVGFAVIVLYLFGWLVCRVQACLVVWGFFVKRHCEVPGYLEIAGMPLRKITE